MSIFVALKETTRSSTTKENVSMADIVASFEDINSASTALSALATTAAKLEKSLEITQALENIDGYVAGVTAIESYGISLRTIGNEDMAYSVATAFEDSNDTTVATEAISDTLKSVWEKMKEYAKKVWEFIRNLFIKVVNFIRGMFGKGGVGVEELKELLKKADKDKRTYLDADEFPEATAKRLTNDVSFILMTNEGKLGVKEYTDFYNKKVKVIENFNKDNTINDFTEILNTINDIKVEGVVEALKFITEIKEEKVSDDVKSIIEDEIGDDEIIINVAANADELFVVTFVKKDEFDDAVKEFNNAGEESDNDKKVSKLADALRKLKNNFDIKGYSIKIPSKEVDDRYEDIVPLDFNDAKSFVDALENGAKKAEKVASDLEKAIEKVEKAFDKAKINIDDKNDKKVAELFLSIANAFFTKLAKEAFQMTAKAILEVASPRAGSVVKESVRLYKKNK